MAQATPSALTASLDGARAERGALVFCRDAASFEMVVRLNANAYGGRLIRTIFANTSSTSGNQENATTCAPSREERLLFVRDVAGAEEEIQNRLDPFSNRIRSQGLSSPTSTGKKRQRGYRDSSEGSESELESDDDDSDVSD